MRTIALEEHYATPEFMRGAGAWLAGYPVVDPLLDLGEGRIAAMDAAGIDVAALSLTAPGAEQVDAAEAVAVAEESNAALAAAIASYPDRLRGFATLPTAAPDAAARELERAMGVDGFVGAVINGHCGGRYLDDQFFWPIFEAAAALDAPIYLHPTPPPRAVTEACYSGLSEQVSFTLSTAAWGWHIDTGLHVLRLILGGVFDRFPTLQIVVGHMGEGLPFMLPRLNSTLPTQVTGLQRSVADYLRQNVHYTFANFNYPATFANLLAEIGIERILFSTDHPYGSMSDSRAFLDTIPVEEADRERIAHGNAEKLLKL